MRELANKLTGESATGESASRATGKSASELAREIATTAKSEIVTRATSSEKSKVKSEVARRKRCAAGCWSLTERQVLVQACSLSSAGSRDENKNRRMRRKEHSRQGNGAWNKTTATFQRAR